MENNVKASEPIDFGRIRMPWSYGSSSLNLQTQYIIKNFIPADSLVAIYGPSGHCKSFLALSAAAHIAAGKDFNNKKTKKGAVLYISAEGGNGIHGRIRGWETRHNDGIALSNMMILTDGVILSDEEDQEQIWLMCERARHDTGLPVVLIVVDTVARCLDGDESSAKDMGGFIRGADTIRKRTGATILLIHHTGKDASKGPRGSSSFHAALDAEYYLRRESGDEDDYSVLLTCTKLKDGPAQKELVFEHGIEFIGYDEDGETINTLVTSRFSRESQLKLIGNMRRLMDIISRYDDSGVACRIAVRNEYASSNFGRDLKKLASKGLIHDDEDAKKIYIVNPQNV